VGTVIAGRYQLLEEIGDGGMGRVWMAEQREPVKRLVAVKLIKPGMDSRAVLARFEAERQALALMDHPNIAKVLDGGTAEDGRPYFVMELVKGLPLTEYCDSRRLQVSDRLRLFAQICSAVQHAHQKAVIHRDLKPSNVLVTEHDGEPVPKVIDFGLAKALGSSNVLTERTLHTAYGTVVGTPLYMAPEQVGINALDVDTRTDVYSLGVILYELLAGSTPLEKARFKQAAWDEVKRLIREEEPPRPSTRLSSSANLPSVAASRRVEPAQLPRLVRGELDWIVMKALEKDRRRRYETVGAFSSDVQRYITGEPVLAVPPSMSYRLRKFARKNRAVITTAAAITLLLLGGILVTTWQALRARRAEAAAQQALLRARAAQQAEAERAAGESAAKRDAEAKRAEAQHQRFRAEAEERIAEEEKRAAQTVRDFLLDKLLGRADPLQQADALLKAGGSATEAKENPTIRELLDRAAREIAADRIDASFPNQPLIQAHLLSTVGNAYRGIGEYEPAINCLERSLALFRKHAGTDHADTLITLSNLALACYEAGKTDLAVPLAEESLKLAQARFGPDDRETLIRMSNLSFVYWSAGKRAEALPIMEQAVKLQETKLGRDHQETLTNRSNLAEAYLQAGKSEIAMALLEETFKSASEKLGRNHTVTLSSMRKLAEAFLATAAKQAWSKRDQDCAATCARALQFGKGTSDLTTAERVAKACSLCPAADAARLAAALALARKAVELGKDHPFLPYFQLTLGMAQYRSGHFKEADATLAASVNAAKNSSTIAGIAGCYRAMSLYQEGQHDQARRLLTEAASIMKPLPRDEQAPANHDDLIQWMAYKEANTLIGTK
jgi:serine/threonine protein kinase/tetratricopeptide (TPR) repeat protein